MENVSLMQNKVRDAINQNKMLHKEDRVVVGVSGGADSTALLASLVQLNSVYHVRLRVVHVHHGLRGKEADLDATFVQNLCKRFSVPCRIVYVKVAPFASKHHMSIEEAARYLRYKSLEDEAQKWEKADDTQRPVKIALAHNKQDNAETIIMQLSRGSGLKGAAGIKPVRGRIIRPMLDVTRPEVEEYLRKEDLVFRTDSSNLEDAYTRNRVRNNIIPLLIDEVNKGAIENITRAAKLIGMADQYIEKQATKEYKAMVRSQKRHISKAKLPIKEMQAQDPILQTYIIRLALTDVNVNLKNLTARHIEDIRSLLSMQTGKSIDLPYSMRAVRDYEHIIIEKNTAKAKLLEDGQTPLDSAEAATEGMQGETMAVESATDANVLIQKPEKPKRKSEKDLWEFDVIVPKGRVKVGDAPTDANRKWFDYDKINGIMETRVRKSGDMISIRGGKKSVKAFMIDEKIPQEIRDRIPVLAVGSSVMWIVGHRIGEKFKVTSQTRRILSVEYKGEII